MVKVGDLVKVVNVPHPEHGRLHFIQDGALCIVDEVIDDGVGGVTWITVQGPSVKDDAWGFHTAGSNVSQMLQPHDFIEQRT